MVIKMTESKSINESIDDVKSIKSCIQSWVTGVSDGGGQNSAYFAKWLAETEPSTPSIDFEKFAEVAFLLGYQVYKTNHGYFGDEDYLIVHPKGHPQDYLIDLDDDAKEECKDMLNDLVKVESFNGKSSITEAANPDNAELNMKIAKTLATKLTKEPKYRADLEAAGFELYDSDWSTYKNWAVKGPNGKSVVLSKGYDNKPRIYNSANSLATKDAINVFDFVNYLTMDFTDRHDYRAHGGIGRTNSDNVYIKNKDGSAIDADFSPETKTQQYQRLQKSVKDAKWDIDYYSREIDRIHTQIAQLQKDADRYLDNKSKSKDSLMTKLSEIDTLLKSMGVRTEAVHKLTARIKDDSGTGTDYMDSPRYTADRFLDLDIPDMCADTLKVLDNMSESTLAELINACKTFYNTLDEICTLHS